MNSNIHERAGRIFFGACELEGAERTRYLDEACGGDAGLRAHVEGLLRGDASEKSLLGVVAEGLLRPVTASGSPGPVPKEVGPYRILREIGRGGMGAVYLAQRVDRQFEQEVAIKIVRPELSSTEIVQRFRSERQILADLDHTNIARLLDGGALPDGRPYVVMEYVEGLPIDRFCDERKLSIEARLGLFRTICLGVQHAHERHVIHRDLKPSNILVNEDGIPKLFDFGIAKILDEHSDLTRAETRTGERLLTPEYASPEQVRGESVSAASDVYSLGILLYQLITGRRPYELRSTSLFQLERAILEHLPETPSHLVVQPREAAEDETTQELAEHRATTPDRLRRRLRGDLDNIVMTALRKEPARRYLTAQALADDVRRHLDGHPVAARADTWRYRSKKFLRRNWALALACGFIFLLLSASSLTMYLQSERVREERDRAQLESATNAEIVDFLVQLFQGASPSDGGGVNMTARHLLDSGRDRIDELSDEPAIQARLLDAIGRSYQYLELGEDAEPLLWRSIELAKELYGSNSKELAEPLHRIAKLRIDDGAFDEAREMYNRVLSIHESHMPGNDAKVAESLANLGFLELHLGGFDEAEELILEALEIYAEIEGYEASIAVGYANLMFSSFAQGDTESGFRYYEEVQPFLERLPPTSRTNMSVLGHIASEYERQGNYERSVENYQIFVNHTLRSFGEDHPEYAYALGQLASAKRFTARFEEALADYGRAIEIYEQADALGLRYAATLYGFASALIDAQRYEEAQDPLYMSLDIRERLLPAGHRHLIHSLDNAALLHTRLKELEEAEEIYLQIFEEIKETSGNLLALANARHNYGSLLSRVERFEEAEAALDQALEMRRSVREDDWVSAETLSLLARVYAETGRAAEAERAYDEAYHHFKDPAVLHQAHTHIGRRARFLVKIGRYEDAATALRETIEVYARRFPLDPLQSPLFRVDLIRCLALMKRFGEAESELELLLADPAIRRGDHPVVPRHTYRAAIELYEAWKQPERADSFRAMLASLERE